MGDYKIVVGLILLLSIDLFFFLGQNAMAAVNAESTQIHNFDGSLLSQYDEGNYTIPTDAKLPEGDGSVSPTTGNIFTDVITNIKEAVLNIPVLGTVLQIIVATPTFISSTGLPALAKFALNAFYYGVFSFLFVAFVWGRE